MPKKPPQPPAAITIPLPALNEPEAERQALLARVWTDPQRMHGQPCIKGTRIPVALLLGFLAGGTPPTQIIASYPQLTLADIHAACAYAAETLDPR